MKYIYILLLLTISSTLRAQVEGVVKDATGLPIAGAHVSWLNTHSGVSTDAEGFFAIEKPAQSHKLVISFIGFESDTLHISSKREKVEVILREGVLLNEVNVISRKLGTLKLRNSVLNEDMITSKELSRDACCNLGESFVTNPSVDVSYSDAATGAKQIRLLGLSGTYVQMMTENIPNYRGAASPYGLGYVPGPWMESIQVSKGSSSVKNGYESLTGQINVEFKKPQLPEADLLSGNVFLGSTGRYELNADASLKLSKGWSTALLAHYESEKESHDSDKDGFMDLPQVEQYNVWNRWAYVGDRYRFQAGIKVLNETRNSGQTTHGAAHHTQDIYNIGIETNRYEAFSKNAYIINKEKNTNLALILQGVLHKQDAAYGYKKYDVDQTTFYASLLFETDLGNNQSLSTGLSFNHDGYRQSYRPENIREGAVSKKYIKENVPGMYAQYTLNLNDRLILMGGIRGDYSSEYGFFVTPRAHIKYNLNEYIHTRLSVGKGYRYAHVLAENNYLLASSRTINIAANLKQEEAWNYGTSVSTYLPLFGKTLNLNAEYFYTDFVNQVVMDMDSNPHEVSFYNLSGRSYSHVFQVEAHYPLFEGFTLTAAYRTTDAKTSYNGKLLEKPLTSRYKGLLTASYQTPLGLWQFDATLQLNGGGRMPAPYTLPDGKPSWEHRYGSYRLLNAQITRYFRNWSVYVGGENLTNFKQKNAIIDASNPWGNHFDATMVWGPMHGVKAYVGLRFNIPRG